MQFVVLLDQPILVFLCFLSELGTRTERTDGRLYYSSGLSVQWSQR